MKPTFYPLGATGLEVTRLGLGLAALGRPGYINIGHAEDLAFNYVVEAMERRTHRLLDLAYENGIRYFDAARSYGRAERFLLSWLQEKAPDDVTVASKWGYTYTADWEVETDIHEVKDHSLSNLHKQWDESKVLLPWLRLYQIHSATFKSGVLDDKSVLNRLAKIREKEGVKIGLSLSGPKQADVLRRAMAIEIDGQRLFDVCQATYNVLEQSAGPALREAAELGMGVIVKEALANGRLTSRNHDEDFALNKQRLEIMGREYGVGMDAIALAFVLSRPWVHVVLSGAAVENHLLSNLDALKIDLGPDAQSQIAAMGVECEAYWKKRSKLAWN